MNKAVAVNGLILGGFALITTSIIALTYSLTHERIEEAKERQLLSTLNQVVSENLHDNELHQDCVTIAATPFLGNKPQRIFRARLLGQNTALILETTAADGYNGAIDLVVALSAQGNKDIVLGARTVNHKETPGLGDKIELRISDWILSFNQVMYDDEIASRWKVKKDGGQFDQFTGATITPRAVVKAIKQTAQYGQSNMDTLFALPANCSQLPLQDTTAAANDYIKGRAQDVQ